MIGEGGRKEGLLAGEFADSPTLFWQSVGNLPETGLSPMTGGRKGASHRHIPSYSHAQATHSPQTASVGATKLPITRD